MRHPCPILKMRASTHRRAPRRTCGAARRQPGRRGRAAPPRRTRSTSPPLASSAACQCAPSVPTGCASTRWLEVAPRSRADGDVVDGGRHGSRRLGAQASHAGWNKRLQTHIQYVWGNLVVGLPARSAGNFRILWAQFAGFRRGAPTFFGWAFYLLCFW
jgi:hypothetical protein